jgi:hypothetical protein
MPGGLERLRRVGRRQVGWRAHLIGLPDDRDVIVVEAGVRTTERVVPPAGEAYAFDRHIWTRRVEVYVSATGRSVRVWVDGQEVPR